MVRPGTGQQGLQRCSRLRPRGKVTPDPSAPGAGDAAPTVPPGKRSGVVSNLAAGANDAIAGTLGAPADLVTGALNLPSRAINAVAGTSLPTIQNPVGGSNWWRGAMGPGRRRSPRCCIIWPGRQSGPAVSAAALLVPCCPLGAARAIAAPAMALPVLEAGATATSAAPGIAATLAAPSAASTALSGAASGAGGALAERVGPQPSMRRWPAWSGKWLGVLCLRVASPLALGLPKVWRRLRTMWLPHWGCLLAWRRPARRWHLFWTIAGTPVMGASGAPLQASPNQLDMARDRLASAAGKPPPSAAAAAIPATVPRRGTVPGTTPTLAQATGNRGLASLEGQLRGPSNSSSAAPFDAVDARNASARVAAVNAVGWKSGSRRRCRSICAAPPPAI